MAYMVTACMVMAHMDMACMIMAYIVMADVVMACIIMAYVVRLVSVCEDKSAASQHGACPNHN